MTQRYAFPFFPKTKLPANLCKKMGKELSDSLPVYKELSELRYGVKPDVQVQFNGLVAFGGLLDKLKHLSSLHDNDRIAICIEAALLHLKDCDVELIYDVISLTDSTVERFCKINTEFKI